MKTLEQLSPYFEEFNKNEMENLYGGKSIIKIPIGSPGPTYPDPPFEFY